MTNSWGGRDCGLFSLNIVASISGAAVDANEFLVATLFRNLDLRYTMRPLGNNSDTPFVLTDGGLDADNLGVFSLIRRGCKHIIAVDAEYDPKFEFDGYFRLNANLKTLSNNRVQYKLAFNVPGIHDFWLKANNDSQEKSWQCPGNRSRSEDGILFDCKEPVLEGWVAKCDWDDSNESKLECVSASHSPIRITYVKLSADRSILNDPERGDDRYGPIVMKFYKSNDKEFPQYPTSNIAWEEDWFMAVLELGYQVVKSNQELFK